MDIPLLSRGSSEDGSNINFIGIEGVVKFCFQVQTHLEFVIKTNRVCITVDEEDLGERSPVIYRIGNFRLCNRGFCSKGERQYCAEKDEFRC